jgi:thioredoxin-like negative regulator of GroEL
VVKDVASSLRGVVAITAVNVDDNQPLLQRLRSHVPGIPTLLILKNGRVIESLSGDAQHIEQRLLSHYD